MRSPLYPGNSSAGSSTFTHCLVNKSSSGHFAIGQHLLLVLAFDFGMHRPRQRLGRFFGGDADGFAGAYVFYAQIFYAEINEGRGHLSPVAKFQGALAETASGDYGYGVGGAAVDFYERHQAFAIFTARVVDAQLLESQHRQAHAEHLSGAEMAVGDFGFAKIFVEGKHLHF
jgi:hypothetical protein